MKGAGDFEIRLRSRARRSRARSAAPWGYAGRNIHFGIREHAMGSAVNGMAAHGGVMPVRRDLPGLLRLHAPADPPGRALRATSRSSSSPTTASPSARTARPTSRSSRSMSLRLIPKLTVIRPADANETAEAWRRRARASRPDLPDPLAPGPADPRHVAARRARSAGRLHPARTATASRTSS